MSPSVSVLTGFDCIFIISRLGYEKTELKHEPLHVSAVPSLLNLGLGQVLLYTGKNLDAR